MNVAGYGRYKDDSDLIGCPRAQSDMTPCIARDGALALADASYGKTCVGCDARPNVLLRELGDKRWREGTSDAQADRLRTLVCEVTEPGATANSQPMPDNRKDPA